MKAWMAVLGVLSAVALLTPAATVVPKAKASPLLALSATATPPIPPTPPIPGLGKPEEVAHFRLVVSGTQIARFALHDIVPVPPPGCSVDFTDEVVETWDWGRGKGVQIEFRRYKSGLVLPQRVGRKPGDTAFTVQGTVSASAEGTYNGPGEAVCLSAPVSQQNCNAEYPVTAAFHLLYNSRTQRVTLESIRAETIQKEPWKECGVSREAGGGGQGATYSFPSLLPFKRSLTLAKVFGRQPAILVRPVLNSKSFDTTPPATADHISSTVTLRLIRVAH